MSLVKNHVPDSGEIIDYLRGHPDFFVKHPELLAGLKIPHMTDENVPSLIEYQVKRLREQVNTLQRQKEQLEQHTGLNRGLAENIHQLSLQLLSSANLNELYCNLCQGLKTFYSADRVLLLLFARTGKITAYSDMKFMSPRCRLKFMFTELFHRGKPLCDSLQEEHLNVLFVKNVASIKSTVLLPMNHKSWQGLLILGSGEANRYRHGFDLELLVYLRDILLVLLHEFLISGKR